MSIGIEIVSNTLTRGGWFDSQSTSVYWDGNPLFRYYWRLFGKDLNDFQKREILEQKFAYTPGGLQHIAFVRYVKGKAHWDYPFAKLSDEEKQRLLALLE